MIPATDDEDSDGAEAGTDHFDNDVDMAYTGAYSIPMPELSDEQLDLYDFALFSLNARQTAKIHRLMLGTRFFQDVEHRVPRDQQSLYRSVMRFLTRTIKVIDAR